MIAKVAFYKAKYGNWVDKTIALWTRSKYSHVELVVEDLWYSSSPRDGGVRRSKIVPKDSHWDYLMVEIDEEWVNELYGTSKGSGYDFKGIALSQVFPLDRHDKDKWFCSEWVMEALQVSDSYKYSPRAVFEYIRNKNESK